MKIKILLLSILLFFSHNALALSSGECSFTNQKLTYSGVNLPSSNDIYKDGEVLGQLILSFSYSCKTSSKTNNNVVLQVGTRGASNNFISNGRFRSNVSGIVLESKFSTHSVASFENEILIHQRLIL